jgi:hypothetical protein
MVILTEVLYSFTQTLYINVVLFSPNAHYLRLSYSYRIIIHGVSSTLENKQSRNRAN